MIYWYLKKNRNEKKKDYWFILLLGNPHLKIKLNLKDKIGIRGHVVVRINKEDSLS